MNPPLGRARILFILVKCYLDNGLSQPRPANQVGIDGGVYMSLLNFLARLLVISLIASPVLAENSTAIPGFTIHHNAIPSASLEPSVARQYGIQRSKYRGMLNVSIIKTVEGTTGTSSEAVVMAKANNIRGQLISIPMRKVTEGEAIYYIGEFRIADQETLNFEIKVQPRGERRFYTAKLSQDFYID
jgi:hypothetical protein